MAEGGGGRGGGLTDTLFLRQADRLALLAQLLSEQSQLLWVDSALTGRCPFVAGRCVHEPQRRVYRLELLVPGRLDRRLLALDQSLHPLHRCEQVGLRRLHQTVAREVVVG